MAQVRTAIVLCLLLVLPLLTGCGRRGTGYDAAAVAHDLGEMLRQPADFHALYKEYSHTPDFKNFLRELHSRLQGSAIAIRDPRGALAAALELVRRHHLEGVLIGDPLLLTHYHADLFIALLTLEEAEIEKFFAGLRELTMRALNDAGVRPEVLEGVKRALRALGLRQPFAGTSPPYAAETYGDRLGEIPQTVELMLEFLRQGWEILGFYEEGQAQITRRFNHLQAVIDLVAAKGPVAIFLQVEQALDGTDRDLKQVTDRVEATADYLQEGSWAEDFGLAPGSKAVVALVVEEGATEKLWQEIERRAGFLKEPVPILMAYGGGEFKGLNLAATEAKELLQALGYPSLSLSCPGLMSMTSCFRLA